MKIGPGCSWRAGMEPTWWEGRGQVAPHWAPPHLAKRSYKQTKGMVSVCIIFLKTACQDQSRTVNKVLGKPGL